MYDDFLNDEIVKDSLDGEAFDSGTDEVLDLLKEQMECVENLLSKSQELSVQIDKQDEKTSRLIDELSSIRGEFGSILDNADTIFSDEEVEE